MTSAIGSLVRAARMICRSGAVGILLGNHAIAGVIEIFHADSLGGPMSWLKKAFAAKHSGVPINYTPATSRNVPGVFFAGEICDVFPPSSSPIADELVTKN